MNYTQAILHEGRINKAKLKRAIGIIKRVKRDSIIDDDLEKEIDEFLEQFEGGK